MMTALLKMPGRTRENETIINGQLVERTLYVDAEHSKACAELWATGRYSRLGITEGENPDLEDIGFLSDFKKVTRIHLMYIQESQPGTTLGTRKYAYGIFLQR
jgi:hypothetical protein